MYVLTDREVEIETLYVLTDREVEIETLYVLTDREVEIETKDDICQYQWRILDNVVVTAVMDMSHHRDGRRRVY